MFRIEHNVQTGEIIEIPLTEQEIIEFNRLQDEAREKDLFFQKQLEEKNNLKKSLLERLGITEEEAKLLLS